MGQTIGARLSGLKIKESLATGFCLNARGGMEIIMATIALNVGLIYPELFVSIVFFAVVSCFLAEYAIKNNII